VISPETRMMGLPCGEEIMIVGRTMWTQSTSVTDRRTDGRTDRITITDTVQTASHGNYLSCNVISVKMCTRDITYLHVLVCSDAIDSSADLWNVTSYSLLTMTKLQMYALY